MRADQKEIGPTSVDLRWSPTTDYGGAYDSIGNGDNEPVAQIATTDIRRGEIVFGTRDVFKGK